METNLIQFLQNNYNYLHFCSNTTNFQNKQKSDLYPPLLLRNSREREY